MKESILAIDPIWPNDSASSQIFRSKVSALIRAETKKIALSYLMTTTRQVLAPSIATGIQFTPESFLRVCMAPDCLC